MGGGGSAAGGGASQGQWGGLHATHYYHMYTSRGDVCLEIWGYGGMYVIIALSHLCGEESLKRRYVAAPWSTCLRKTRQNVASPTQGATPKRGSPYPQIKGPRQGVGVRIPNSRGHAKAWGSLSPNQGATPKRGSPYPQLKGPRQSVGVPIPNSRGHAKARESVSLTQGATLKRGSPYPQLKGPQNSLSKEIFGAFWGPVAKAT